MKHGKEKLSNQGARFVVDQVVQEASGNKENLQCFENRNPHPRKKQASASRRKGCFGHRATRREKMHSERSLEQEELTPQSRGTGVLQGAWGREKGAPGPGAVPAEIDGLRRSGHVSITPVTISRRSGGSWNDIGRFLEIAVNTVLRCTVENKGCRTPPDLRSPLHGSRKTNSTAREFGRSELERSWGGVSRRKPLAVCMEPSSLGGGRVCWLC
ncbi:uncharacterized protein LOC144580706 [Callithrix jacchus]